METLNSQPLILASKSPRRKNLLEQMGIKIKIIPADINENRIDIKNPKKHVKQLSFMKAEEISGLYPESWVIGADTIVTYCGRIMGKPRSKTDAIQMLSHLNNAEHSVYTAFCLINRKKNTRIIKSVKTQVFFKTLTLNEIQWYVHTGEPFDKAGGYGIQGKGAFLVKQISGSYSNVVGLPVCEVIEILKKLNIIQFKE